VAVVKWIEGPAQHPDSFTASALAQGWYSNSTSAIRTVSPG
jgi:hypothetical protein